MDARYVNAFLEALVKVLGNFGITDVKRGSIVKKENMHVDMDITSVVGLIGDVRGNVAYSLNRDTAKVIISRMMFGTPVTEIDAIARSAVGELANMITGEASGAIAAIETGKTVADITPPSVIIGRDVLFLISSVPAIAVSMDTQFGRIEVNIGLEI